jgi:hypothetical protein
MNREASRGSALRALVVAAAASVLACGDPLSPLDIAGTYALESRDGARLPVLMYAGGAMDIYLMSETLVLRADRGGAMTWVHEHRRVGGETETITSERALSYDTVDERIEITMICGPAELCAPPPHLVLRRSSRGLESIAAPGPEVTLSYVRVSLMGPHGL